MGVGGYDGLGEDYKKKRITQHKNGEVKSIRNRRPLELIHCEIYLKEFDARRRERFLKITEIKCLLKMQIKDLLAEINWRGGRVVEGATLEKS